MLSDFHHHNKRGKRRTRPTPTVIAANETASVTTSNTTTNTVAIIRGTSEPATLQQQETDAPLGADFLYPLSTTFPRRLKSTTFPIDNQGDHGLIDHLADSKVQKSPLFNKASNKPAGRVYSNKASLAFCNGCVLPPIAATNTSNWTPHNEMVMRQQCQTLHID
jgi:hypothetical protein